MNCNSFFDIINYDTHAELTLKNEVIFCEFEFVGVRGYGRVQIRKKQGMERLSR